MTIRVRNNTQKEKEKIEKRERKQSERDPASAAECLSRAVQPVNRALHLLS